MRTSRGSDLWDRLQSLLGEGHRLERELIGGGMSRLFLATDCALQRQVVVKVLPPELSGEVSAARFQREISLTAHFQHPHILPILSAGADESLLYYVMPYVEGESLQQRMRREGPLPCAAALRLCSEIADALAYAHSQGVVHRDVKPANILLTGDHAVLVDFGVAQAVMEAATDTRITTTGNFVGTTQYMAPEQFAALPDVDGRADVFALGVVIHEALTGALPFAAESDPTSSLRVTTTPRPISDVRPDVPRRVSDLVVRALALEPDARLGSAAELRDGLATALVRKSSAFARLGRRGGRHAAALALLVLAAAATAALYFREEAPPAVDHDRVAIAPFEVMQPEHALWREGFVDVLSTNLDGAGPLRAVPPSVVIRRWSGRPDVESAVAFGRRVGARFVILGRVLSAGSDSARVDAWLVDVVTGRRAEVIEIRDGTSRMDRMADSLTLALLRDIGAVRPVSAVRRSSLGSTSLPALRWFLEGERHFRRTNWDSARAAYDRAILIDSSFALAHSHIGLTFAWQRFGTDSLARVHALRAGALNVGLSTRDSLLILADSLRSVAYAYGGDPHYRAHVERLFSALQEATRSYEQDAEAWYRLADAYFHFALGPALSISEREILRTFDRALSLDSAFAPAYIHPVELGFATGDTELALRYARRYFALKPSDVSAAGTLLAAQLLSGAPGDRTRARTTLDTASADLLFQAYSAARRALGGELVAAHLLALMASGRRADYAPLAAPAFARSRLVLQLAYRGRFGQALALPESRRAGAFAEMAMAGAVDPQEASRVFAGWLRERPLEAGFRYPLLASAGAWWAQQRDTISLKEMAALSRSGGATDAAASAAARYSTAVAGAYLALARADSAMAVRRFAALPAHLCQMCAVPRLVQARLLAARGSAQEASIILAERPTLLPSAIDVLWALEGARAAERLGDATTARARYSMVVRAWSGGDPAVQPIVSEARAALQRLRR